LDAQTFNQLIGRNPEADADHPAPSVDVAPDPTSSGNGQHTRTE